MFSFFNKLGLCRSCVVINLMMILSSGSITALEEQKFSKRLWTYYKYELAHSHDQRQQIERLLKDNQVQETVDEKIWYFMTESTLASMQGGVQGIHTLSQAKDKIEDQLQNPINDDQFMACAVLGYLYAKAPGWPLGFGSKARSQYWLKKAHLREYNSDVAFYLAQAYHQLGNDEQANYFAELSFVNFDDTHDLYASGKRAEIGNFSFFNQ